MLNNWKRFSTRLTKGFVKIKTDNRILILGLQALASLDCAQVKIVTTKKLNNDSQFVESTI